jgi:hypothetical protein
MPLANTALFIDGNSAKTYGLQVGLNRPRKRHNAKNAMFAKGGTFPRVGKLPVAMTGATLQNRWDKAPIIGISRHLAPSHQSALFKASASKELMTESPSASSES